MSKLSTFVKATLGATAIAFGLSAAAPAMAQEANNEVLTLDQLLERVKKGRIEENQENKRREAEFRRARDQQARLLREAEEEVGLPRDGVRLLGRVDPYLPSTGFRVTPVVGLIDPDWTPVPDPAEVEHVFEPPLDFLMDPANRQRHHHDRNGYRRYYYAMPWNGHYIWGATAGMLKGLSDRLAAVTENAR